MPDTRNSQARDVVGERRDVLNFERLFGAEKAPAPATTSDVFRALVTLGSSGASSEFQPVAHSELWSYGMGRAQHTLHTNSLISRPFFDELRFGWIWFSGTVNSGSGGTEGDDGRGGQSITYCFPALSVRIEYRDNVVRTGSPVVYAPIADVGRKAELSKGLAAEWSSAMRDLQPLESERWNDYPDLAEWVNNVADGMGLTISEVTEEDPKLRMSQPGIRLCIGGAVYTNEGKPTRKTHYNLRALEELPNIANTALSKIYGSRDKGPTTGRELVSFRPLSLRQRRVASRVAGEGLAVVSGGPGTGKSHVLSVVAADAMARGESVLVLAGTPNAVDVLIEHFAATPGPPPIAFGGSRFGKKVSRELVELASLISDDEDVDEEKVRAARQHDERVEATRNAVMVLSEATRLERDMEYRSEVEAALSRAGDLRKLGELVYQLTHPKIFPVHRKVKKRIGLVEGAEEKLAQLRIQQDALLQLDAFDVSLTARFDELAAEEQAAARVGGELLTDHWIGTLRRRDKATLQELAKAVLAKPESRRLALASMNASALTSAAPLWVGSVSDVDEVLPPAVAMFDLVILDEAAQIDQGQAAHALIRAKRALVFGDREQIGHSWDLPDEKVAAVIESHRLDPAAFSPKEMSTFDIAAARVPAEVLDEHFRSVPHLIEFSSRRFYDGSLFTVARNLANESADHIDVAVVDGTRDADGVNVSEVEECLRLISTFVEAGCSSLGVITPFEAQAEALTKAVEAKFEGAGQRDHGIRVGTVRLFQGDERDIMIASFGVGASEADHHWASVNEPNLFNVMVTRAREQMVVVTSNPAPPGLAGEFVQWAEPLTDLVRDVELTNPWIHRVAAALRERHVPVRIGYQAGRYVIDLVAGSAESAVAIDCVVDDDVEAHIDRAMTLRRVGWRTADAYELAWRYKLDFWVDELLVRFPDIAQETS